MTAPSAPALDRAGALERFTRTRTRTQALFDVLDDSVYYERPIALRNPVVFYEGHLPAFAVNTLIKKGLGRPGIDAHLERIFERGIDPDSEQAAQARGNPSWPSRAEVRQYAAEADRIIGDAIANDDVVCDDRPLLRGGEALWAILEHEEMHQETLAYMWHELPASLKRKPWSYETLPPSHGAASRDDRAFVQAGRATLGTPGEQTFAWDNERPAYTVDVDAFWIDVNNVTNARFMEFVEAGGYRDERWWSPEDWGWVATEQIGHPHFWVRENGGWMWRAMFEHVPLPLSWPVYVTAAEACAFARWSGTRLMTEAEFHRAAYGTPDGHSAHSHDGQRQYPWGDEMPRRAPANFDFRRWDPQPAGAAPQAASAFGIHDLVGNGWEWTSSVFAPFDGFAPLASYPEYSADFFDGEHRVLKGASPFTARGLVRRGFRNWFRTRYPYVYATFRCVSDI
jgi:ergothioneine biosynthesis protein EgtB